jgi:NAD+ kinase
MSLFKSVALIGKYKSPEIAEPLLRLAAFLSGRGVSVRLDTYTAEQIGHNDYIVASLEEIGASCDLAIVIGGDGTMLNIARTLAPHGVALVGVNQGRLGFLTDLSMETMTESIGSILDGNFVTDARMLLESDVYLGDEPERKVLALNDVSINKGADGSLIELEVHVDGRFVYNLRSDGLIVASPTGSTAYALSSGGPILHPGLSCIALVPVSPHTLSNRPIIVGGDAKIEITMHKSVDARVHFDSHSRFELGEGDRIVVRCSSHPIRLLHPEGYDYYHMLREKLHWSETL